MMINKYNAFPLLLITLAFNQPLQAHNGTAYWSSSNGKPVHTTYGCLRTGNWSANKALPGCEPGMTFDKDNDGVSDSKDECPATAAGISVDAKGCAKDSDGDGITDNNDRCSGTPAGISVDAAGCPKDSDGDGAADSYDKCPGTPAGINVDSTGCPMDSDGDGAADSYDKCPGTPAGVSVDSTGCPLSMDDDNDGIVNAKDDCKGTAAGTVVNNRGCKLKADIALDNVVFTTGTAKLDSASRNRLDNVAQVLKENTHLNFEIAGHTDNTGNYQSNVNLSESRAQSVRQYLIDNGVAADRLTARGYGPDKPVASNDSGKGRSMNRRVELTKN